MHKLVEMKKCENNFDDNNEKDFEEDGVDVLSGSCRAPALSLNFCKPIHSFQCVSTCFLEKKKVRLDKAFRAWHFKTTVFD